MQKPQSTVRRLAFCFGMLAVSQVAFGQKPQGLPGEYPARAVRVIVGTSPGGGADLIARMMAQQLTNRWTTPFIVENRTSQMGSAMALDYTSKAPKDGYNLMLVTAATYVGAAIVHKIPPSVMTVIDPVAQFTETPFLLMVNSKVPAKTLPAFIDYLKANAGKTNYASAGVGSSSHLAAEYLIHELRLSSVHIPYKGIGAAYADLLAGRTQWTFSATNSALPHIKKGSLLALATTTRERLKDFPDVSPLADVVPGFEYAGFFGMVGPAGMPQVIVNALNQEINKILVVPEINKILSIGDVVTPRTSGQFRSAINDFVVKTDRLVREANLNLLP